MADVCADPRDKLPYLADTFALIRKLGPEIRRRSQLVGVPPIAVGGSIADEFNTQTGARTYLDWFQDQVLLKRLLSNQAIERDHRLGFKSKLLNATMHDLGIGNIKLDTAMQMYNANQATFGKKIGSWSEMVEYILTDAGTIHIAALVIKQGQTDLTAYLKGQPADVQEAILITYYKQGPNYVTRYAERLKKTPAATIQPGEGCRAFTQRTEFVKALGLSQ